MKYYDFDKSLVLNSKGEWDFSKMQDFLWSFSTTFIPAYGGTNTFPFTKGKSEEFAKENGLYEEGTGQSLYILARLLDKEGLALWQNHLNDPYDADEYVRMALDRDHLGQFIIELQTYHLYIADKKLVYDPNSKNSRMYAKYLNYGLDIHYSDRRYVR